jgi:hypothetical protein
LTIEGSRLIPTFDRDHPECAVEHLEDRAVVANTETVFLGARERLGKLKAGSGCAAKKRELLAMRLQCPALLIRNDRP